MQIKYFVKAFLKDPLAVSTIFAASETLARQMAEDSDIRNAKNIVEIGVGTGALTRPILKVMKGDQIYTGFEIDKNFFDFLESDFKTENRKEISKVKNFNLLHESAENLSKHFDDDSVDVVVSSLPWAAFNSELQHTLMDEVLKVLKPGGTFSYYNYITSSQLKNAKDYRSLIRSKFKSLERKKITLINIPPANIWVAKK